MAKVVLITGASSGIGYTTAELLAKQGHKVYAGARREDRMEPLRALGVTPLTLDVTDRASCLAAAELVKSREGRIDVLVNNAGYGSFGPIEVVPLDEARRQFDVNVFGLAQMIQAVLPTMRDQRTGTVINISSVGGRVTSHFGDWYHASKYAVEALSDALRMEVREFGIEVSVVEPAGIKSEWGGIAADSLEKAGQGTAYAAQTKKSADGMRQQFSNPMFVADPITIAKTIGVAVNRRRPKARYLVGAAAKIFVFLHAILPARVFDAMMLKVA